MKTLRNSLIFTLAIVALAMLVAAPVANAGTVPYTATVNTQLTDLHNVTPESGVLSEFNNVTGPYAGYTLNSVTISILGTGSTTFTSIYNFGDSSTEFIGTQNTTLWLDDPTNSGIDALLGPLNASITGSSPGSVVHGSVTGGLSINAGQTLTDPPTNMGPYTLGGSLASETITNPTSLALFEGDGNLDFVMSTGSNFQLTTNGADDLTATIVTDAGGSITVTYDYTPPGPPVIPEPGTLSLFGTGLLGLAGMLRFRFMNSR